MWNVVKHKYFKFAAVIMLIFMPLVLVVNQKQQETRGRAEQSTTLSFSPQTTSNNPLQIARGESINLDLVLNPGKNIISLVKVDILYDPARIKLSPSNPVTVNKTAFPNILEGPTYLEGRVRLVLSVGSDFSKAVTSETKVLTANFVAAGTAEQTIVSLGPASQAYTVPGDDSMGAQVLSTTSPAYIKIISK